MRTRVDYRDLIKFRDRLESLDPDEVIESIAKEITARLLSRTIRRTHEITGHLRRGWTGGVERSVPDYIQDIAITKHGDVYEIIVENSVEYALYVEYGHRTRDGAGWVPGQFMLTISEQEINGQKDRIVEQKIVALLKEVFR